MRGLAEMGAFPPRSAQEAELPESRSPQLPPPREHRKAGGRLQRRQAGSDPGEAEPPAQSRTPWGSASAGLRDSGCLTRAAPRSRLGRGGREPHPGRGPRGPCCGFPPDLKRARARARPARVRMAASAAARAQAGATGLGLTGTAGRPDAEPRAPRILRGPRPLPSLEKPDWNGCF